jgi:hypothetical protein
MCGDCCASSLSQVFACHHEYCDYFMTLFLTSLMFCRLELCACPF